MKVSTALLLLHPYGVVEKVLLLWINHSQLQIHSGWRAIRIISDLAGDR